jgi:hypothetical protein
MQDEFAPRVVLPAAERLVACRSGRGDVDGITRPVSANFYLATLDQVTREDQMFRIKKREWCMACLSESATRAQPMRKRV